MNEILYAQQTPRDGFQQGKQPAALKDAGLQEKVAVIGGAGWAHKQYLATALEHRGSDVLIVDPNEWGEQKRQYGEQEHSFLDNKSELREQLWCAAASFSVPSEFKEQMETVLETRNISPLFVEQLQEAENVLRIERNAKEAKQGDLEKLYTKINKEIHAPGAISDKLQNIFKIVSSESKREDLAKEVVQALKDEEVDYLVISSSSPSHAAYIKAAQELGMPAMVQSPMVAGADPQAQQDARVELDQFIKKAPLYVMNPGAIAAAPLLKALGKLTVFDGLPEEFGSLIEVNGDFKAFRADKIEKIEIQHMEGWLHPEDRRNELLARYDVSHGGGALYDSAIAPLGALAEAGIVPIHVSEATLKAVASAEPIATQNMLQTENLAEATLNTKADGTGIPVSLVVGKKVEGYNVGESITLVDNKGNKLTYEKSAEEERALVAPNEGAVTLERRNEQNAYFATYRVKLENKDGQLLAESVMKADPYALAVQEATQFFAQNKEQGQGKYTGATMHYDTQSAALSVLEATHAKGRGIELQPPAIAELGSAEVTQQRTQGQGR